MALDSHLPHATEPELHNHPIAFTGAGAGNPTKTVGKGVAITWVSSGRYRLTFVDPPGNLISTGGPCLQDATPANLKNFSAVFGSFDATGKIVDVYFYNGSGTLTDLTSTNKVAFDLKFKRAELAL